MGPFDLSEWATEVVGALGYLGVAMLIALENLFPPIPSEVVLPLTGFVASQGSVTLPGMIAAATIGSIVGAWVLYLAAAAIGEKRVRRWVSRWGRWFRVSNDDLDRADSWFDTHGSRAVLFGRCVPLIRSLVSIPAGFRRMPPVRFTLLTVAGSLVWNIGLVGAGYLLGERWDTVEDYLGWVQLLVIAAIVAALGWFVWRRFLQDRISGT